jgi:uncharacterized membrane protein YdjX (TVP38/TMEM64 family)
MIEEAAAAVAWLKSQPAAPAVFTAAYAGACFFAPITLFPVAGGVLFGFWGGLLCNLAGAWLGSLGAFFLIRRLGEGAVDRIAGKTLRRFRAYSREYGFWTMLIVRLAGFPPFLAANYLAGLSGISWKSYASATFIGILPWTAMITFFAHSLWQTFLLAGPVGLKKAVLARGEIFAVQLALVAAAVTAGVVLQRRAAARARKK